MPLMSWVRYGQLRLETMLTDSSVSAFFLLHEIYIKIKSDNLFEVNLIGIFDQLLFFFSSFIPREIFPNKPLGFGRLYVEKELNVTHYSDGHSIAATFLGDPIYYLGKYLWIPFILVFIWFFNTFYNFLREKNGNLHIIFLIFIPTFIWGGMASFSSRFLFLTIFIYMIYKVLYRIRGL